jgi:hypothetical protein
VINPSVSIGVVSYPDDGRTSDELMITADESMYRSKRSGKNRMTGVPVMDVEAAGRPAEDIAAARAAATATVATEPAGAVAPVAAGRTTRPRTPRKRASGPTGDTV